MPSLLINDEKIKDPERAAHVSNSLFIYFYLSSGE
jgi:hypothetical protein